MGNLKRFTTQYKGKEDRIFFTGEDKEGETVSLWLTQRLLLKTVPVLVKWLQENDLVDLKTTDNSAQAVEMAQIFSRDPVRPNAKTDNESAQENSAADSQPPPATADISLVDNIDISLGEKLIRLRLRQGDQALGSLALTGSQLRQWLAVLHVLWKNAGWPSHIWPHWLSEDTKLVSNQTQDAFH